MHSPGRTRARGPPYSDFGGDLHLGRAKAVHPLLLLTQSPLTETLWLVLNGQHPDQLALCPSRKVPFKYRSSFIDLQEQLLCSTSPVKKARTPTPSPPPPPASPSQPSRPEKFNTFFFRDQSDVRKIYSLDYHYYLYNRADFRAEIPSPCQQHTRCETVEMPRARNSPWQISNCAGSRNLTRG